MSTPSDRLAELALERRILQQRSALLRRTLATQITQGVAPVMGGADRVMAAGQWLRRHPALLVGGAVALLVWRPKGVFKGALGLLGRGLWAWQTWQKLQPVVARVSEQVGALRGEPVSAGHRTPGLGSDAPQTKA